MSTDTRWAGLTPEHVLRRAQEIYQTDRFAGPHEFEWKQELRYLLDSGLFTVPQAAAIVGVNVAHARRVLAEVEGKLDRNVRTRYGVSGRFNPDSLPTIRTLRGQWYSSTPRQRMDYATEQAVLDLIDQGNGVRVIEHLTTIPSAYIYRAVNRRRELEKLAHEQGR